MFFFYLLNKIIYICRNIKDNVVSMYNMLRNFPHEKFEGTLDDMVDLYIENKIWFGPWHGHVDQFSVLPNIHFIHYENLLMVIYLCLKSF